MPTDLQDNLALKKLRDFEPEAVEDARIFRDEVTIYIGRRLFWCESVNFCVMSPP